MVRGYAARLLTGVVVLLAASGCAEAPGNRSAASPGEPANGQTRIASLSPAMTGTVNELGGGEYIVGRTPWCLSQAPVVGTLQECDMERLVRVRPTVLLVQAMALSPDLSRVARTLGAQVVCCHVDHLVDIEKMLDAVAQELERAGVPGVRARQVQLLEEAERQRQAGAPAVAAAGPTLLLFSAEPLTAFGAGTYVDELWRQMGGTNALERPGYPELSLEDVVRLDPAHIVLVRMGSQGEEGVAPGMAVTLPSNLRALPERFQERICVAVAPVLLEPGAAFLRDAPRALAEMAACVAQPQAPATDSSLAPVAEESSP